MDRNSERILLVHSVTEANPEELRTVQDAILTFRRPDSSVQAIPVIFAVPSGAAPGATLGTELTEDLRSCVGAVVFVDDLRPNVAYELGFFHGQGRTVLLLAHHDVDSIWKSISDLAGAALESVDQTNLRPVVHSYLNRLYEELATVSAWPGAELPSAEHNLLGQLPELLTTPELHRDGPWGPFLRVRAWDGIEFDVGLNLSPGAGFKIVLRALRHDADYSIYFRARFTDRNGSRHGVWLGLTSRRRESGLKADERTFPARAPTKNWQILTGKFQDLLDRGYLFAGGPVFYLDGILFRAGTPGQSAASPVELGFVEIVGVDR
jgi:hypothetical protein